MIQFEDFFIQYPRYNKFSNSKQMKDIFQLITSPECIKEMIDTSESQKPALSVCIEEIECQYHEENFNIGEDFTKQALGAMVAVALEPFGYTPVKQKVLSNSQYIKTAAVYSLTKAPRFKVHTQISIEKVKEEETFEYVISYKDGAEISESKRTFYNVNTRLKNIAKDILKVKGEKPTITIYLGARKYEVITEQERGFKEDEERKQLLKNKFIEELKKSTGIDVEKYANIEIDTSTWRLYK